MTRSIGAITIGDGDFQLRLTRHETGLVTAALAIAANEYQARNTGANTTAGRKLDGTVQLHKRITAALTKGARR